MNEFVSSFGRLAANHLWQSTAFAAVAVLLALALRANHARARYWLWLAASVKFLVPFSAVAAIGTALGRWLLPVAPPSRFPFVMEQIVEPFASSPDAVGPVAVSAPAPNILPALPLAVWLCGFLAVLLYAWVRWRRVAAAIRSAKPLTEGRELEAWGRLASRPSGIRLVSSGAKLEPGVFGIFRPVLWLPAGIGNRLEDAELEAVLAHELCHIRRRDNLLATLHLLIESLFWFHPLVWWLGARLEEERERACDEEVVRLGGEPQIYAESILKVCEFYLASPVACVAGATGGELTKRIEGIMSNRFTRELTLGRKVLLTAAALVAIGVPVGIGVMTPQPSHAQSRVAAPAGAAPAFEVASVKPSSPQAVGLRIRRDPGLFDYGNVALIDYLSEAYNVDSQLISGLSWPDAGARYDIVAKIPKGVPASQVPAMLQRLLMARFKLKVHHETKVTDVYVLSVGKGGSKLERAEDGPAEDPSDNDRYFTVGSASGSASHPAEGFHLLGNLRPPELRFQAVAVTMAKFSSLLKSYVHVPVVDGTGLPGHYNFTFEFEYAFEAGPDGMIPPGSIAPSVFTAVEHLGLKLEARRLPIDHLVVDHAEKIPIEN
jgi:uncharacterized protein (TIGR03435 family)